MNRLEQLRSQLVGEGLDALLVSGCENLNYLSGFTGSAGFLLISPTRAILATDFRYIEQAKVQAPLFEVTEVRGEPHQWLPGLVAKVGSDALGFEARDITVAAYRKIEAALVREEVGLKLVPTEGLVEPLRAVKEYEEVKLITNAAALADAALAHARKIVRPGMTETALAWEIEKCLREGGSSVPPFDLIVASGPNGALPHARPSERTLSNGEPVVIDIGARVGGYASDLTRTLCMGEPDGRFRELYDLVLNAQLVALSGIRSGMTGEQADSLARGIIQDAGYGHAFGHGLGHGVGLATHEDPRLGPGASQELQTDMVFTVEPGVYIPGWGGIRIEDMALLTASGPRPLTHCPK
ncbi:MAG: Xaa-Pro peptidase family protein [Dehalococcoidia bacterium]|nr:Xaa-Pro peptidase family protein [Dehalococcoidia bacterium]MDP7239602.1 Xaa-Pro peptidase family protein [Dehalococcoidia bacterium]